VISWTELTDDARADVNQLQTVVGITQAQLLRWASQAQHKLQEASRAVRRLLDIEAADLDADGQVDLDDDIWLVKSAYRISSDNRKLGRVVKVSQDEISDIERIGTVYNCNHFLAIDRRVMTFAPVIPDGETVEITYNPHLLPYTSKRGSVPGDWEGAVNDATLTTWMDEHGIAEEFWPKMEAVQAFVSMNIMNESNLTRMFAWKYKEYKEEWESALHYVLSDQQESGVNDTAPSYGGPIR